MSASAWLCSMPRPNGRGREKPGRRNVHVHEPAGGHARRSTDVACLIDTNVLVYRYDPRFPEKQRTATTVLRELLASGEARVPHQAIVEFVAATTRGSPAARLLDPADARREAEEMLAEFPILYPNETVVRTALRGAAAYGLSWFDAHIWAYAEVYGLGELLSEDFQHRRLYGTVRVRNPFATE